MANTRDTIGDQATVDGLVNHTLTSLEEDGISMLGDRALYNNTALTSVNFPNAVELGDHSLAGCTGLTNLTLPKVDTVSQYAFSGCTNLTTVNLSGTGTKTIAANAFNGCSKLAHVLINSSSMSTLSNVSAFTGTPIARREGAIYVPAALVSTYKANARWDNFFIASIDDYPLDDFSTISDSWATIIANANYATDYAIGDTKLVDLGTLGTHYFELVAIDEDTKADGTGKARMTWLNKNLLTTHAMNSANTTSGGYDATAMKAYLTGTVKPLIPAEIRNAIVPVTKISGTYESGAVVKNGQSTTEEVWIPSEYEIFGTTTYEDTGAKYTAKFSSAAKRIKYNSSGSANSWWLRSANSGTSFRCVGSNGNAYNSGASIASGVVLGFCL